MAQSSMLSYPLSAKFTQRLKEIQSNFTTYYTAISKADQAELDFIHRYAHISMIGASTRIENAILTDSEISWIDTILSLDGKTTAFQKYRQQIVAKLSKDRERSIEEVAGCRVMLSLIYEQAKEMVPLTESHIRGLHSELLRHYEQSEHYRGQYKTNSNSVAEHERSTGAQRIIFRTADPGPITKAAMTDLMAWYTETVLSEPWSVAVACEFIFRFLAIHPFQDGNGRLGRGLFLLCLLQCPDNPVSFVSRYLAIDRQIEKHKEEYYLVLQRCSDGQYQNDPKLYRIEIFLQFMLKILDQAFKDIDLNRRKFRAFRNLSPSTLSVLESFKNKPEIRLRISDLISETNLPRRTIGNALETLIKEEFIQKYGQGAGVRYQLIF